MRKSIEELEGEAWNTPNDDSYLVETCRELRKKAIDDFEVEDLRIMIGQNIGTAHILPRAIDLLVRNPMIAGDFYPGDLFVNVFKLPDSFWEDQDKLRSRCKEVAKKCIQLLEKDWDERRQNAMARYGAQMEGEGAAQENEAEIMATARQFLRK